MSDYEPTKEKLYKGIQEKTLSPKRSADTHLRKLYGGHKGLHIYVSRRNFSSLR